MAKFNLKEHILKNKATFFGSLTEGQFSWMTQDTGQQIGSQDENKIPVYMFDDKGKYYYENDYDGYGVFGGKDYYELLDQMNGGIGDRSEGIRKAFDAPAVAAGEILFPALITDPYKFNYKTHDFTQEAETDPNQSWYEPEEDDYIVGDDADDDYVNRYGDEDELDENVDQPEEEGKGPSKTDLEKAKIDQPETELKESTNLKDAKSAKEYVAMSLANFYSLDPDIRTQRKEKLMDLKLDGTDNIEDIAIILEKRPEFYFNLKRVVAQAVKDSKKWFPTFESETKLNETAYNAPLTDEEYKLVKKEMSRYYNVPEENLDGTILDDYSTDNLKKIAPALGAKDLYSLMLKLKAAKMSARIELGTWEPESGLPSKDIVYPKGSRMDENKPTTKKSELKEYEVIYYYEGSKCMSRNDEGEVMQVSIDKCRRFAQNENKTTTKMKKSELKAKIKEMIVAEYERDVDYTDETAGFDPLYELEGMLNEAEGLTPLQQYIYDYESDVSGEDFADEELENIKKLNTPDDVYEYYASERGWEDDEDLYPELKSLYKTLVKKFSNLNEADETEKDTAEVDTTDITVDDTETIDTTTTAEVNPDVKAVQDALTQAQAAAQKLGDQKLTDQIGNTITFFTRAHVVEKGAVAEGDKKYYKDAEADDAEHIDALKKDMKDDKKSSMNESMFPILKKILK